MKKTLEIALVVLALAASANAAKAATITYTLNDGGSCCTPAPFGTVTLTDIALGNVQVTVALTSGNRFVDTGGGGVFGFNLIGFSPSTPNPPISVANITSGFSLISGTAGALSFSPFRNFEFGIACGVCGSGGSNPQLGPLMFNVLAANITTASFVELSTTPNGSISAFFAADIIDRNGRTGNVGVTGPGTPGTSVPDGGSTAALLGSVLFGVGLMRRKFGKV